MGAPAQFSLSFNSQIASLVLMNILRATLHRSYLRTQRSAEAVSRMPGLEGRSPSGAKEAAEKVRRADSSRAEGMTKIKGLYGTAKAVPFQNTLQSDFSASL